jgi:hypothetical protein
VLRESPSIFAISGSLIMQLWLVFMVGLSGSANQFPSPSGKSVQRTETDSGDILLTIGHLMSYRNERVWRRGRRVGWIFRFALQE